MLPHRARLRACGRELRAAGLAVRCPVSGVRLGLPGRFQAASGAGLRELGRLAEAVDELLEDSFRAACPSAHMDGAYEKVLARAHGARLALRLLPPYQGATEDAYRRFEAGLGRLPGLEAQ